jgi:hypothetical protein
MRYLGIAKNFPYVGNELRGKVESENVVHHNRNSVYLIETFESALRFSFFFN